MFNSKFNVGVLKHPGYNVGGGIGEAALIGAAFGGAKSLATGEDLLEGALLGGITGGAMSGVTGALFGGAGAGAGAGAGTVASTADDAAGLALQQSAQQAGNASLNIPSTYSSALSSAPASAQTLADMEAAKAAMAASSNVTPVATATPAGGISDFLSKPGLDLRQYTSPDTMAGKGLEWWEKQNVGGRAMYSGLGGAAYGMMNPNPVEMPKLEEKKSPLAGYNRAEFTPYSPEQPNPYYRAQYAEGGIAALAQGGMGNNVNFPQGRLDTTQYATPTQMPTSAQVVNADYEAKTDPYSGSPLKMAEGGIARYAVGGDTGGQVYYDAAKGQYYTQKDTGGWFNTGNTNSSNLMGSLLRKTLPQGAMDDPNSPYWNGRTYLGSQLGQDTSFQAPQIVPNVYQPQAYATQIAQAATNPAVQQAVIGGSDYSLADSLPLLQATSPGIAAMYSAPTPSAPVEVEKKAEGGIAGYNLGGYASGGNPRLLKGPGDGMSDNIPATIGDRQPARLADGEFVVPADVVSHLGNGSTDAGAKHLYGMMDKVRKARTGNKKQGKQINPAKFMPA